MSLIYFYFFLFDRSENLCRTRNRSEKKLVLGVIMVVVENGSSNRTDSHTDVDQSKSNHAVIPHGNGDTVLRSSDPNFNMIVHQQQKMNGAVNHKAQMSVVQHGINGNGVQNHQMVPNGVELRRNGDDGGEGFKREMRDLEEMLSKLNPMAEEFVPPSLTNHKPVSQFSGHLGYANNFVMQNESGIANGNTARRVVVVILYSFLQAPSGC